MIGQQDTGTERTHRTIILYRLPPRQRSAPLSARLTSPALLRYSALEETTWAEKPERVGSMAEKTGATDTGAPSATGDVTTPASPAGGQGKPRSGLTGHILPSFWRKHTPAAPKVTIGPPASSAAAGTSATLAAVVPGRAKLRRWWSRLAGQDESVGRAAALIILCALLSLGIYLYGTLRFPLAPNLTPTPLDLGKLTGYNPVDGEFFLLAIALLFGAWGLVCWVAGRIERQARTGWWRAPWLLSGPLFSFPIIALLVQLFMYPITALDVVDYASQIRVWTIYHANPLTIAPLAFPGDPFLPFNIYPWMPSPYGPLWIILSAQASQFAGDSILAAVIAQKMLSILACIGSMRLVWLLAERLRPERRWQAFVFFAWNPLVLFETGANGHNDVVMVFFILAGLLALISSRWYWQTLALPFLVASVLIKWTSVLLLPLALIYLLRGGRARRWGLAPLGVGTALTLAYVVPLIAAFGDAHHTPGVLLQSQSFTASLAALIHLLLLPIYNDPLAGAAARDIGIGAFALVYLFLLARFAFPGARERLAVDGKLAEPQRLLVASLESYFWYFVLATFWFQAWYLIALLPLAALAPSPLTRIRGALFSFGAMLSYVIFIFLWVVYWWTQPVFSVELVACVVIFALPLMTRALEGWQTRQRLYALLARAQFPLAPADAETPRRRKSWWLL